MILLQYVVKLLLCSGLLFLYYWLFLRNKQFHRYNRFYLLVTVLVSLVFPFINIPLFVSDTSSETPVFIQAIQTVTTITTFKHSFSLTELFNWQNTVLFIYVTGITILFIALVKSLLYIRRIRHRYAAEKLDDLRLYNTNEQGTPFSFFKSIFWNQQISFQSNEGQQIFRHEVFHVRQQHSLDNLFIEIVTCIAWFNPFFYLIKKEVNAIHEFLADQFALSGSDRYAYAELLVLESIRTKQHSLTHPFFNTQIKRRIAMITQFKNKKYGYWSRVMALPVAIVLFCSFVITIKTKLDANEENPYKEVQQSLIKNIRYPAKALVENKQGEVIVSFVIAENGSISNTTLLTEDDFGMGSEVLSTLQKIPANKLVDLRRNRSGAHVLKTTYLLESSDNKIPYVNAARISKIFTNEKTVLDFEIVVTSFAKDKIRAESKDDQFVRLLKITDTV
ncbi:MAG: M56 family metallopeptidase, partial [Chitinophagaceae bacterium]